MFVQKSLLMPDLDAASSENVPMLEAADVVKVFPGQKFEFRREVVHEPHFYYLKFLPPSPVICDVGGNVGQSVRSIHLVKPNAKIYSFDINPYVWPDLLEAGLRFGKNFQLFRHGLGEYDCLIVFYVPTIGDAAISTLGAVNLDDLRARNVRELLMGMADGAPVKVFKMRSKIKRFDGLALKPDFIKIDVEGHELEVLKGMQKTLESVRPDLLIENSHLDNVATYLSKFGYIPCGWSAEEECLKIGYGHHNTIYIHAEKFYSIYRGDRNIVANILDGVYNKYERPLSGEVTQSDVEAAFRTFFGSDPLPSQVDVHVKAHRSRLALRNHFIKFLATRTRSNQM